MHVDREPLDPEFRDKARRVLETMCEVEGISFSDLKNNLAWADKDVQACLGYLNSHGYVAARVLPSLKVRYCVTELGWSLREWLAHLPASDQGE